VNLISLTATPARVNTGPGTGLSATLSASSNDWASFAADEAGSFSLVSSVQDGSESDLDPAAGKVKVWVPSSELGTVGESTFRAWQNNRQVFLSSQLATLGASGSVAATVQVVAAPAIYGNIDGDGLLSPVDVSYLLQYIVSLRNLTITQRNWVDVNFDGSVNSLDASFLLQKLLTPSFCLPASGVCPPSKEAPAQALGLAWATMTTSGQTFYELRLTGAGALSADLHISGLTDAKPSWIAAPDDWLSAWNGEGETLRLAVAGALPATDGTALLRIPASAVPDWEAVSFDRVEVSGQAVEPPTPSGLTTSLGDEESMPTEFALQPNFPNPFNPTTTLRVELPQASNVEVSVYDLTGRVVMQLPARSLQAGRHSITLDASMLGSGVYVYRVSTGTWMASGKMTLVK
jgi:hypothetical protein